MKAAVLQHFGAIPQFEEFPDPIAGPGEVLIQVKAIVLENVNKMMAKGTHYSSKQFFPGFPGVAGHAGIGQTADGRRVSFRGMKPPFGAFAEKAVVPSKLTMPVPGGIDDAIAAALPASALTSLLPLKYSANLLKGESVLINGATGVSGKIAIQIAKLLGAGKVTGTGRNESLLKLILDLGADSVINLQETDEQLAASFKREAGENGFDIVLDYLWGRPAELLIKSFIPKELSLAKKRIRYVHIGEMAGSTIRLSGESLRTSGLEIFGSSNIPPDAIPEALEQVWSWALDKKLFMEIERVPLSQISEAWEREDLKGKRLVIIP